MSALERKSAVRQLGDESLALLVCERVVEHYCTFEFLVSKAEKEKRKKKRRRGGGRGGEKKLLEDGEFKN